MKGACLRHLRKRAGIKAKEAAAAIEINAGHLAYLERKNKELRLPLSSWFLLAELLGIPIDKLPR